MIDARERDRFRIPTYESEVDVRERGRSPKSAEVDIQRPRSISENEVDVPTAGSMYESEIDPRGLGRCFENQIDVSRARSMFAMTQIDD